MTYYPNSNEWETIKKAIYKNRRIVYAVMAVLALIVIVFGHNTTHEQLQLLNPEAQGSKLYLVLTNQSLTQVLQAAFDSLTMLAFISLVMERSLEVFTSTFFAPKKLFLKEYIQQLTKNADAADKDNVQKLKTAREELTRHNVTTKIITLLVALGGGIVLGLAGIRVFEPLFAPESLYAMPWLQQTLFRIMDIALTGLALAGGSDGIHLISKRLGSHINPDKEDADHDSLTAKPSLSPNG